MKREKVEWLVGCISYVYACVNLVGNAASLHISSTFGAGMNLIISPLEYSSRLLSFEVHAIF